MRKRRKETRHLHFDLSGSPAGVTHTLHLGHRKLELIPHDDASRAAVRAERELYRHIPDERLTHHLPEATVYADAIQSYWISHPSIFGRPLPTLSGTGIMIPKAVARRAHQRLGFQRGLFSAKARQLGLIAPLPPPRPKGAPAPIVPGPIVPPPPPPPQQQPPAWLNDGDLADFTDMNDAAVFLCYHHNNLVTLTADAGSDSGSDTAVDILTAVENAPNFAIYDQSGNLIGGLVWALVQQGYAQNLQQWEEGYEGFSNGQPWLDANGQQLINSATQLPEWWYVPTDMTSTAMTPVVSWALQNVNDQAHLDNISFNIDYGRQSVVQNGDSGGGSGVVVHPKRGVSNKAPVTLDGGGSGYGWQLGDADYHFGRQIVLGEIDDRTVNFTINNSYFRHLGVFVRFLDVNGNPIALSSLPPDQQPTPTPWDTTYDSFQQYVGPRPRLLGVPTSDAESEEISVLLPDAASSMMILAGSMGIGAIDPLYPGVEVPGALLTGIFDLALPALFLGLGVAASMIENACVETATDFALWLLETFTPAIAIAAMPGDSASKSTLNTEWAGDVLQSVITEAPSQFIGLLECAGEVAGAEEALEALPIVGQVLFAINTAATLTELLETTCDVLTSPWIVPDQLTSTLTLDVTVNRDPNDYEYPATAQTMELTATLSGSIAYTATVDLLSTYSDYPLTANGGITYSFTIPSGGDVEVVANFIAANGWLAASGNVSGPNVLDGNATLNMTVTLTENPVPLTSTTQYQHQRILQYDSLTDPTEHVWVNTTTPPTATVANLGGNAAVTLNALDGITVNMNGRAGYAWAGLSPQLLPPGQTSWNGTAPQVLYTAQSVNIGSGSPDDDLLILAASGVQYGYTAPIFIVDDLLGPSNGLNFIVAPAVDPTTNLAEYHAFQVDLDGTTPIDLSTYQSWGRFASQTIDAIAVHPRGFILALNANAEKVELLELPPQPYASLSDALYATQTGGQGSYIGRLHGSRGISATKDGNGFLVLEAVNERIQIFSVTGTSIPNYFPSQPDPWIPLPQPEDKGLIINWLSMALENTGYIYVLSSVNPGTDPSQYRLDIFDPTGAHLSRTTNVPAAEITVDAFRVLYTENYQLIVGPNQRPEPSISAWVAIDSGT